MDRIATVFDASTREDLELQMLDGVRDAKTTALYWAEANRNSQLSEDVKLLRNALREHRRDLVGRCEAAREARAERREWRLDMGKSGAWGVLMFVLFGWVPFGVVAMGASGYLESVQFRWAMAVLVLLLVAVLAAKHAEAKRPPER